MLMMALLPPGGLPGGYAGDPDGASGSWEEACTCVSTPIRVRVAVAAIRCTIMGPRISRVAGGSGHGILLVASRQALPPVPATCSR
eukprot:COSAG02_NODE_163_length_32424_cov_21.759010_14_plen_86_part_00